MLEMLVSGILETYIAGLLTKGRSSGGRMAGASKRDQSREEGDHAEHTGEEGTRGKDCRVSTFFTLLKE